MNKTENTGKAHLVFSDDKTTCHVVFANGTESIDYEEEYLLLNEFSSMLEKKKISKAELVFLKEQLLEEGQLSKGVTFVIVAITQKNVTEGFCMN